MINAGALTRMLASMADDNATTDRDKMCALLSEAAKYQKYFCRSLSKHPAAAYLMRNKSFNNCRNQPHLKAGV